MKNNDMKKIAIVGLPNSGKSQTFNNLTHKYNIVSNAPLTTADIKRVRCKIKGKHFEVLDTPGLYSLYIHSEEELIIRNMLFEEQPDIIIQCIDTNRLRQSLKLTADLLELQIPLVIALTGLDESLTKGIYINSSNLVNFLGVKVVETVSISNFGTEDLKEAICDAQKSTRKIAYDDFMENAITQIEELLPKDLKFKRKLAVLLLLQDTYLEDFLISQYGEPLFHTLTQKVQFLLKRFKGSIAVLVQKYRNKWIERIAAKVIEKKDSKERPYLRNFASLSRHPVWGLPIFLLFVLIMYFLVVNVANFLAAWMTEIFWVPLESRIDILLGPGFWNDFLIGHYGILSLGLSNALLTVLPILSVFFPTGSRRGRCPTR